MSIIKVSGYFALKSRYVEAFRKDVPSRMISITNIAYIDDAEILDLLRLSGLHFKHLWN